MGALAAVLAGLLGGSLWASPAEDALRRGQQAIDKGDLDQALPHLDRAIRLDPKCAEAYQARGWVLAQKFELDRAVADYSEAMRLDDQSAETYCNRGDAYGKLGQLDRALADLRRAIELDPKLPEARLVRAYILAEQGDFEKALIDCSEGIRLDPENAQGYFQRARCHAELKNFGKAVEDLDVVLRQEPDHLPALAARGAAWLLLGDFRRGIPDLEAAIRKNARDAGADYRPWAEGSGQLEALEHGRRQIRRMLQDRPAMSQHMGPDDALWKWAERKFAGEGIEAPIDWDPTPPTDSEAEHVAPSGGRHGYVRVSATWLTGPKAGKPRSFEELWANLIFELHNFALVKHFVRLHQEAALGTLTKEQFIAEILRHEYTAAQQTRAFYLRVYLPWAEKKKLPTDPAHWFTDWWDDPEDALHGFVDRTSYPWRPYARHYDWATARRLWKQQKYREAAELLEGMAAEKEYTEDRLHVLLWLGRSRQEANMLDRAIEAFTEAIALAPSHANLYQFRGEVYRQQGKRAKADADFAKARQLDPGRP